MPPAIARRTVASGAGRVPVDAYQGGEYASAFQDATNAQGAMLREDFQKDIGRAIGGLNATGALRSGRASTTLNDVTTNYGRQVGNVAAANAGQLAQLNQSSAEGEANRGVQREGIASGERIAGNRLAFDERSGDRDFGRLTSRDAVADAQYGKEFDYRTGRDATTDAREDRNFGEGVRQFDTGMDFSKERAGRQDLESDRTFGEGKRQFDTGMDFSRERATRQDADSDREFGYRGERDTIGDARDQRNFDRGVTESDRGYNRGVLESDRGYNRGVVESDRSFGEGQRQFNVSRDDQRTAARQSSQGSIWGSILGGVGAVAGTFLGGPVGTAIGSKIGSAIGGKVGQKKTYSNAGQETGGMVMS